MSCALVSSASRISSQFHLFGDVSICPDLIQYRAYRTFSSHFLEPRSATVQRGAKFCAVVRQSAHLASLVRSLRIDESYYTMHELSSAALPNLKEISVFCGQQIHLTRGYNIIEDVPCGLFALPSITRVEVLGRDVDLPCSFFRICNSVTALMLENTTIVAPTELPLSPLSRSSRPRIESLKMWNCLVRVPSLNLDMDFSHLRELDLRKVYLYHGDLSDFIRSSLQRK
ncbi:hypothetical protein B0H13DRAFT_1873579 [Mycena leptocephala]|nr:hypothetical protein B0H13DRAFT_1873579 [Mycena leptocephala]